MAAAAVSLSPIFIGKSFAADNSGDPVLDLLLEKGIISDAEAAKVKAALAERGSNAPPQMPASKWLISKGVKDVELFGDVRLRYEDRNATDPTGGRIELNRLRYALRFGLRGDAFDDFYYGFRLDTGVNPRSPWVTMGTSSSSSAPYQGPFGKSNGGISVGQLYVGWHPASWFNMTVGKMPQPLYTTPMVWDTDICPEGLAEHLTYSIGDLDLFANLGQFLYQDTNPTHASQGYFGLNNLYPSQNGGNANLSFMMAWQGGFRYHFDTNIFFQVAPVLYNYGRHGINTQQSASQIQPGFSDTYVGQGATNGVNGVPASGWSGFPGGFEDGFNANQTGINNLLVLEFPWELNFKIASLDARVFGDYAQNLEGSQRATAAYQASLAPPGPPQIGGVAPISSPQVNDNKAYQFGFAIGNRDSLGLVYGNVSRRHGWEARAYWQHVEQYALDPNLLDSDFFEGAANMEGYYTSFAYGFSDNFIGTFRYGHARRINQMLGTGSSNQDIPQMNPIQHYEIIQLDLTMRF
jgi:hypothetical protein